jgi:8-oxo-dGTP diphosphatase
LKWEFPGGKAEPGERAADCLRRELREELGIDPIVGRLLWRTVHRYPDRAPFALSFLAVRGYRGVLTNRAFAALRWVPVGGLTEIDFLEGDREFVAEILRGDVSLVGAPAAEPGGFLSGSQAFGCSSTERGRRSGAVIPRSIAATTSRAAATGSVASRIGWPTTR